MCGICGFSGNPEGIDRPAMVRSIVHRGPDDHGTYERASPSGAVWFGHQRLAIQDLSSAGHQPMSTPDDRFTIAYNGEIYNFHLLREQLEGQGYRFRGKSDTEVILRAWERWVIGSLDHFRGMFAFALWDNREKALWLVRDRIGEKPLYYTEQPDRLLFASEVRCLLAYKVVERRLDSEGLDSYLTFGSVADPLTLVRGVKALEAGHWLRYQDGRVSTHRYWSLRDIPEGSEDLDRSDSVERVAGLLRESCKLCEVSDVPLAVLLSGGIDSSSNVVLMSEAEEQKLATFSIVFQGSDEAYSEERWSSLVSGRFQTSHRQVTVPESEVCTSVTRAVASMDQPSQDGVNTFLVCGAIRSAGMKVAISGQGGDEIFLGYPSRHSFPPLVSLGRFPLNGFGRRVSAFAARWSRVHDTRYEKIFDTLGSKDPVASAYLSHRCLYSQGGVERLRGQRRPPQTRFVQDCGGSSIHGKLSRLELSMYLRNTLLRDADQMSMAHSLEMRVPLLDYRLIEYVVGLPSAFKVEARRQKPLLVDAVGPKLPREVVERPKRGFSLPFDRWLRNGLCVSDPATVDMGLDPQAIGAVQKRFNAGQIWYRWWSLQVLASWVEREGMSAPLSA